MRPRVAALLGKLARARQVLFRPRDAKRLDVGVELDPLPGQLNQLTCVDRKMDALASAGRCAPRKTRSRSTSFIPTARRENEYCLVESMAWQTRSRSTKVGPRDAKWLDAGVEMDPLPGQLNQLTCVDRKSELRILITFPYNLKLHFFCPFFEKNGAGLSSKLPPLPYRFP